MIVAVVLVLGTVGPTNRPWLMPASIRMLIMSGGSVKLDMDRSDSVPACVAMTWLGLCEDFARFEFSGNLIKARKLTRSSSATHLRV